MKPLNIDKTGCSNISSNCVVWQGPDIECINLCKGDSVTEIVYKLALELCKLVDTFDLTTYDLKCFSSGVCQPQDFRDFINILITKVCALQECNPDCIDSCNPCPIAPPVGAAETGGDPYVPIAKEFQFKNGATGDDVTTLKVSEYAQVIGQKVSSLVNSTNILQATIADHSTRIKNLEDAPAPIVEFPTVTPLGVLPSVATSMQLVLSATEQQFIQLRTALGNENKIYTNIQKQLSNINDLKSLTTPGSNMSSLQGWTSQPADQADILGNALIMIADMRNALVNVISNLLPSDCSAISLSIITAFSGGQLTLYIKGTLPALNFVNTSGQGTIFTITDSNGNSILTTINIFSIINLPAGFVIDLTGTILNTSGNLTITGDPSFTHKTTGSVCQSHLQYTLVNQATCPDVVYTPTDTTIGFSFTTTGAMQAYSVEIWNSSNTVLIASQTFVSNVVQGITGTFDALTSLTLYKLRVKITINGVESPCEFTSVTTI